MNRSLAALAIVALVAAGCATRGSVRRAQDDLAGLRADVTELGHAHELSVRGLERMVGELRALDTRAAELQTALRESAVELTRLRARLDAAEQQLREARALVATPPPPLTPPTPPTAVMPPATSMPPAAVTPLAAAPVPAEPAPRPETVRPDTAGQAYDAAMATFRTREYGQAVLDLLDFIAQHPRHPLAANAQYWIGEAYYVQRDYRQALLEFTKVLEIAPGSPKAADALLKVGLCHTNLREPARAEQAWQLLIRQYPSSGSAVKARDFLRARAARRP